MMVNNNIFSYYSFSLYHIYYFLRQRTISDMIFDNHHHIPPLLIFLVLIAVEYGGSIRLLYCVWDCRFFLADYYLYTYFVLLLFYLLLSLLEQYTTFPTHDVVVLYRQSRRLLHYRQPRPLLQHSHDVGLTFPRIGQEPNRGASAAGFLEVNIQASFVIKFLYGNDPSNL